MNWKSAATPSPALTRSSRTPGSAPRSKAPSYWRNQSTEGSRVKVITENGVVYLMGLATEAEADSALHQDTASDTSGVVKVVRLFEVFDEGV